MTVTTVTNTRACVMFILAARSRPRPMWMDTTTEHPVPIMRPSPVKIISRGMQMFTAAMPSPPTPWPTKMPSMAVTAEMLSIPSSVGMKRRRKSFDIFTVPKSMVSLSIICKFRFRFFVRGGGRGRAAACAAPRRKRRLRGPISIVSRQIYKLFYDFSNDFPYRNSIFISGVRPPPSGL